MSYQVLARKWRPASFAEVAGQAHVLKSLINALDNERLHHAYLFAGTRGVGKTTLARILAKCLNCEEGISSTPCGKCGACSEISAGQFIDLLEVDAASRTKVEDTRELLENVQYTPARGRFKVYLIDEVHMLSNHSFNALLKTLEEPPPHVKFLFATTDPQKLPITILSRCLQFNLKNLSPKLIAEYLDKVLEKEEIEHDSDALWQIAAAAGGSMRDALTLTDQAIAYCQGKIKADGVVEMLGIPEHAQVKSLLEAMANKDIQQVFDLVAHLSERTPDYAHTLDSLLSALHRIAIAQILPEAVDNSYGDKETISQLAGKFSAEDIQLYYQMGTRGRADIKQASDLREAFEMLLLRMLVFSPQFSATASESSAKPEPEKKKDNPQLSELNSVAWAELAPKLPASGLIANILANCNLLQVADKTVHLLLDETNSAAYKDELIPRLEAALSEFYEEPISVEITIGAITEETPAHYTRRRKAENRAELVDDFSQDNNVQQLVQRFSGTLVKDSIMSSAKQ
ncbi:MAG: DNA polymerase III subunit gamma/tau [Pseudohongiellaceae bacterium]